MNKLCLFGAVAAAIGSAIILAQKSLHAKETKENSARELDARTTTRTAVRKFEKAIDTCNLVCPDELLVPTRKDHQDEVIEVRQTVRKSIMEIQNRMRKFNRNDDIVDIESGDLYSDYVDEFDKTVKVFNEAVSSAKKCITMLTGEAFDNADEVDEFYIREKEALNDYEDEYDDEEFIDDYDEDEPKKSKKSKTKKKKKSKKSKTKKKKKSKKLKTKKENFDDEDDFDDEEFKDISDMSVDELEEAFDLDIHDKFQLSNGDERSYVLLIDRKRSSPDASGVYDLEELQDYISTLPDDQIELMYQNGHQIIKVCFDLRCLKSVYVPSNDKYLDDLIELYDRKFKMIEAKAKELTRKDGYYYG